MEVDLGRSESSATHPGLKMGATIATTPAIDVAAIEATSKEFWAAFEALDTDRLAACFAEDAELITTDGIYVGREAVRSWLRWAFSMVTEACLEECGLGSTVAGNRQFREYREMAVTIDGLRYDIRCMAVAEFNASGEYERVSWLPDQWKLIRQIVQQAGLRRLLVHPLLERIDVQGHA